MITKKGNGWYTQEKSREKKEDGSETIIIERIPFEIEIEIDENGNFSGRVFNEASPLGEAKIKNGEMRNDKIAFIKKIYPDEKYAHVHYELIHKGNNKFVGKWFCYILDVLDNDWIPVSGEAEINLN